MAIQTWGTEVGRRYILRVNTLYSMRVFAEIFQQPSWHAHPLTGNRADQFSIRLTGQWRLIITKGDTDTAVNVKEVSNHYD